MFFQSLKSNGKHHFHDNKLTNPSLSQELKGEIQQVLFITTICIMRHGHMRQHNIFDR